MYKRIAKPIKEYTKKVENVFYGMKLRNTRECVIHT